MSDVAHPDAIGAALTTLTASPDGLIAGAGPTGLALAAS